MNNSFCYQEFGRGLQIYRFFNMATTKISNSLIVFISIANSYNLLQKSSFAVHKQPPLILVPYYLIHSITHSWDLPSSSKYRSGWHTYSSRVQWVSRQINSLLHETAGSSGVRGAHKSERASTTRRCFKRKMSLYGSWIIGQVDWWHAQDV